MKLRASSMAAIFTISLILVPYCVSSQTCRKTCGKQPLQYPFGSAAGCGDPRFQKYITCSQDQLTLSTHSGCYPVTSIDYPNQVLYITDPSMSTCSCTNPSKGFGLDWDAPFSFADSTIFALLGCSATSSVYSSGGSAAPRCDPTGAPVCNLLNSCQAVSLVETPVSSCCVYTPVDLGPAFEMDLQKLQCSSYAGIYGFDGKNDDPRTWNYGLALKYKFNFNNDYPGMCASCERSNGVCGYSGNDNSFLCNCPSGLNMTTECFFAASWSNSLVLLPWQAGTWLMCGLAWFMVML
ncbi:wall-associated receptor kinase 3 [Diospyros lotus]|uniref:wall-associated receptor kinase 3 n=1 Tax=Diospyros lotus TaxID=55363 RepID=UPI00225B0880|nr:wall-associated receptor kinase 3 [Diospyros lotus]